MRLRGAIRLVVAFSVGFCVAELRTWHRWDPRAAAAAGAGEASGSGDVNGSGTVDLGDAIYLLNYLFVDGPVPAPCPGTGPCRLPATGQLECYDRTNNTIDCATSDLPGDDGFYRAGCPMEGRFVDNVDGTVTDTCTGLMWQKATAPGTYLWTEALLYCEDLVLAGHDDWRLPNVHELHSIVVYERADPAIDPAFDSIPSAYWSSTTRPNSWSYAWFVSFWSGRVGDDSKRTAYHIRAVRGGLP